MKNSKILIAEDNDLNLKLMFDILSTQNFELETASDGQVALNKLEQGQFDLLLLDLQMPKLSGFKVLEEMKKKNINVKTVVVSACAMSSEVEEAKALGCVDFITKPISLDEFLNTVKKNLPC